MLDREVCQKCINRWDDDSGWSSDDDFKWSNHRVLCPIFKWVQMPTKANELISNITHTDCLPPDFCPYAVEHIVSQKEEVGIC